MKNTSTPLLGSRRKKVRIFQGLTLFAFGWLTLISAPGLADGTLQRFYLGGSVSEDPQMFSQDSSLGTRVDGESFKVFGGIRFTEYVGLEAAYREFGNQVCCDAPVADYGRDLHFYGFSLAVVGVYPAGRFDIFGKLGRFFWDLNGDSFTNAGPFPLSEDESDPFYGAGVHFKATEHLGLRVEWESFDFLSSVAFDEQFDAFSAGAQFSF